MRKDLPSMSLELNALRLMITEGPPKILDDFPITFPIKSVQDVQILNKELKDRGLYLKMFTDVWNVKFPGASQPPQLNCLKADQFSSLLEQKQALEFEESKRCAVIEELKQQVIHENFIVDFLHKCIQKLGAVCQVFNEIDQSDSKSSSSSGTIGRHPGSTGSPPLSNNGSGVTQSNKFLNSASSSNFPIFPHCIASSLIHSASPLLAAAAATSSPFLLPSSLPSFPCPESIK
ncbi:uncharacterized protein DEA37_0001291 [Paragonimus westermani]|uniref:Uncharacterized protein n=1 Tax=Paragonimus westermani TaxID=34504 RepID=A0A5J4NIK5_9TREM|nr:uncharacterized protein DEA37_0001291 [Paragonimus westermani]